MAALLETISANKARPAHRDGDGSAQAALRHGEPTHMSWFETMRGCRGMGPLLHDKNLSCLIIIHSQLRLLQDVR